MIRGLRGALADSLGLASENSDSVVIKSHKAAFPPTQNLAYLRQLDLDSIQWKAQPPPAFPAYPVSRLFLLIHKRTFLMPGIRM